jgi:hypothetical protein
MTLCACGKQASTTSQGPYASGPNSFSFVVVLYDYASFKCDDVFHGTFRMSWWRGKVIIGRTDPLG